MENATMQTFCFYLIRSAIWIKTPWDLSADKSKVQMMNCFNITWFWTENKIKVKVV